MKHFRGKFTDALIYTGEDVIDTGVLEQLATMLSNEAFAETTVRIMPDYHVGKGCMIGTTIKLSKNNQKVVPDHIGVDIGCGIMVVELDSALNMGSIEKLDKNMDTVVKSGFHTWEKLEHPKVAEFLELNKQLRTTALNEFSEKAINSLGTLGGGNHFIEIGLDKTTNKHYLIIHTGSRGFGSRIAKHYQELAYTSTAKRNVAHFIESNPKYKDFYQNGMSYNEIIKAMIEYLKSTGQQRKIEESINEIKELLSLEEFSLDKELAYLTGQDFEDYMHDLQLGQHYASLNRFIIAESIIKFLGVNGKLLCDSVHNYIEKRGEDYIARKGATRANLGEILAIPLNMRDGVIIAQGKGNPEWNFSAPHGAGRVYSRTQAKSNITLKEFRDSMEGVYTTSVVKDTLDEAPQAYKKAEAILSQISDTVDVLTILTPVYNFKASEG